ncbi:major facilitator superfamily (MFS) transporter [Legionella sainthelensi]|uniref:Major facilitator superfamily (MFS) transporter n=1 Tax=Legionella sainthelensi TaxID=28087 RepID=A0A0W0YFX6_9GAMM|nr:MFS transporter [Legionella sainthelensi]KTD55510.1 major facilitator superfamily (MFS) transporter [Legionella sainthelensi]VEH37476.1 major facilitator superfamily (MFS) transporter [Legionella sainthelensi]
MSESMYLSSARTSSAYFNMSLFMLSFFIMKLGQFLIIPFLAIYLNHFSLSPIGIGAIIASGQLSHSLTSLFIGHLSDRYPSQHLFIMTLLGSAIAYECLYQNQSLMCFIVLNTIIGVFRAIFDIASKTFLASNPHEQQRTIAFGVRYAILNLAAALGPLIGARYAVEHSTQLFQLIAYCYLATGLLLLIFWSKKKNRQTKKEPLFSMMNTFRFIKANSSLKILFLINFICYSLYAQITSSLAQYMVQQFDDGIVMYSNMLIVNAITCVLLQIGIGPLLRKVNYMVLAATGLSLFALGFLGFCFAQNSVTMNCSMLILSLGEVIFFPLNDVFLAKIAPPDVIGSCYGVLNGAAMGLAVGPVLGGVIYQLVDYYYLFLICSLGSLLTILLYRKLVA